MRYFGINALRRYFQSNQWQIIQYPLNVYTDVYWDDYIVRANKTISDFSSAHDWKNLTWEIKYYYPGLVNTSRLPQRDSSEPAKLFIPLHQAAHGCAHKKVIKQLLQLGASKTLKTVNGETAYDIAKRLGSDQGILKLLEVPDDIREKTDEIEKMEAGLHKVILGRVKNLIAKNGQALPQLAFLYEFGEFWYPVPGFYGGFSVAKNDKGVETSSWCRVAGGSGKRHVIDKEGNSELVEEGFV